MSTPANITIQNTDCPFSASVSHDGYPDVILAAMACFFSIDKTKNFALLKDSFQDKDEKHPTFGNISDQTYDDAEWSYHINKDGILFVFKNPQKVGDSPVSPYLLLDVIVDSCKEDVRKSIDDSLEAFKKLGIKLGSHQQMARTASP